MDLKFSFGASNPLPLHQEGAGSASNGGGASVLELHVSIAYSPSGEAPELVCEGRSGDGVSYARATKALLSAGADSGAADAETLASALRSVLARGGAELPEPLLGSVTGIAISLDGQEAATLAALGLAVTDHSAQLATVDEALQSRTGIAAGTPITRG